MGRKRFVLEILVGGISLILLFIYSEFAIFSLLLFLLIPIIIKKEELTQSEKEILHRANSYSIIFSSIFFLLVILGERFFFKGFFKNNFKNFNWIVLIISILLLSNGFFGLNFLKERK